VREFRIATNGVGRGCGIPQSQPSTQGDASGRKLLKANQEGELACISRFYLFGSRECPDRPTFALQPLSLQGSAAVNILLGVSSLKAAACADVTLEQARRGLL
jgi:hypothetical protein